MATRVFISFDFDYDSDLKTLLVGQSKHSDSPFDISDWSIKVASPTWRAEAKSRISRSSCVAVVCGRYTHIATGVAAELAIARELNKPYFLLGGRKDGRNRKPTTALSTDKVYDWTWPNLKLLVAGNR